MVVPIKCTCPIAGQFTSQQFLISLNVIRNSCLCRIATWERPATLEAETPACRVSAAGCQSLGEGGFPSGTFGDISYEIHRGYSATQSFLPPTACTKCGTNRVTT